MAFLEASPVGGTLLFRPETIETEKSESKMIQEFPPQKPPMPEETPKKEKESEVIQGSNRVADIVVATGIGGILFGANLGLGTIGSLIFGVVAAALVVLANRKSH
jgi:hypothetical protein